KEAQNFAGSQQKLSTSLKGLAISLAQQERYAEAQDEFQRLLPIEETLIGADNPELREILIRLARMMDAQGLIVDATGVYQRILRNCNAAAKLYVDERLIALSGLAALLRAQGRKVRAAVYVRKALALCDSTDTTFNLDTVDALNRLAHLYELEKNDAEALVIY